MTIPHVDLSGKTCVITGANSGIGKEATLGLARMGARVVMVCRNGPRGEVAADEIRRAANSAQVDLLIADMSLQASVRALADQIKQRYPQVDVLINNAGGAVVHRKLSAEGIEMTIAQNHLGAALLTLELLDALKASAPSRIINVSSQAHQTRNVDLNDLQFERRKYASLSAYGQSKLLMNAFTFELARRLQGSSVTCNCLHPGVVATNIWGVNPPLVFKIIIGIIKPFMLTPQKGAETTLYLATSPEVAQISGEYFIKCKPVKSSALSRDPKISSEVWQWTGKMLGTQPA
jgi:retinol dehydrogenase 12